MIVTDYKENEDGSADVKVHAKAVGLDAAGGQSRTSDGLCVAVDTEKEK